MTADDAAAAHAELAPESTRSRTIVWQDPVAAAGAGAAMAGLDYMRAIAAGELPQGDHLPAIALVGGRGARGAAGGEEVDPIQPSPQA